jgi:hypothetical protein
LESIARVFARFSYSYREEIWQAIIEGLFFSNPEFVGRFMKQAYEDRGESGLAGEWKKKKGFYT